MFYIEYLWDNKYAVMKHYTDNSCADEQWRVVDSYGDAVELCHYLNGGTVREYERGNYILYEWRLVQV